MPNKEIISEVALRLGDSKFQDFEPSLYNQALYRAEREVSKLYEILQKVYSFRLGDQVGNINDDVQLDISDFKSEFRVLVNGNPLIKVKDIILEHNAMCYYIERRDNIWLFNYRINWVMVEGINLTNKDITEEMSKGFFEKNTNTFSDTQKSLDDQITILYTVIPDMESPVGEYLIPSIYEEELIERSLNYLIKLGLARFTAPEMVAKYQRLFQIFLKNSEIDKRIVKNDNIILIQPFRYP